MSEDEAVYEYNKDKLNSITGAIELVARYDCKMGKRKHFIIGHEDGTIAGGLYVKEGTLIPKKVIILFKSTK